jgi:hypothetical protein
MMFRSLSILPLATPSAWLSTGLIQTSPGQAVLNFVRFRAKTFIQGFKTGADCAICTRARGAKPDDWKRIEEVEGGKRTDMARHKKIERRREIERRRRRRAKRKKLRAKGLLPEEGKQGKRS